MSTTRRRPPARSLPPNAGGPSVDTARAPLPVPIPALPRLPGEPGPGPQIPGIPDFSGAIKTFTEQWLGLGQVALGALIVGLGLLVFVESTQLGRSATRAGAMATPWGRAASLVV